MIEFDDLRNGMEVWFCDARISGSGKKLSCSLKPAKYIVEDFVPDKSNYVKITDAKNKWNYYTVSKYNYGSIEGGAVYATERECKEAWNRILQNILDCLQSTYEKNRNNILNKFYKI